MTNRGSPRLQIDLNMTNQIKNVVSFPREKNEGQNADEIGKFVVNR